MARRVSFSPGIDGMPSPLYFTKHDRDIDKPNMVSEHMIKIWTFRPPRKNSGFSAMRFLGRIKAKVARAFGLVSSSSRKISSSSDSSSCNKNCSSLERSRSYVEALDSHRAQAIEDCIQFLHSSSSNSSSSFQRSKSLSSFSC